MAQVIDYLPTSFLIEHYILPAFLLKERTLSSCFRCIICKNLGIYLPANLWREGFNTLLGVWWLLHSDRTSAKLVILFEKFEILVLWFFLREIFKQLHCTIIIFLVPVPEEENEEPFSLYLILLLHKMYLFLCEQNTHT